MCKTSYFIGGQKVRQIDRQQKDKIQKKDRQICRKIDRWKKGNKTNRTDKAPIRGEAANVDLQGTCKLSFMSTC